MEPRRAAAVLVAAAVLGIGGCAEDEPVTLRCAGGPGETRPRPIIDVWGSPTAMAAAQSEPSWGDDTALVEGRVEDGLTTIVVREGDTDLGALHVGGSETGGWTVVSETVCPGVTLPTRTFGG